MSTKNIAGFRIKVARRNLGLTQERMSVKLGRMGVDIDRSSIARIESGLRRLHDFELKAIAKALKTTSSDLVGE